MSIQVTDNDAKILIDMRIRLSNCRKEIIRGGDADPWTEIDRCLDDLDELLTKLGAK
jgi:hypothetical protein